VIKISYSSDLKSSLLKVSSKKNCCRKSEFFGILSSRAFVSQFGISIHSENEEYTEYIKKSVRENFNRELQVVKNQAGRGGSLFFRNDNASKYLSEIDFDGLSPLDVCKCPSCRNAFLRGVFVASGRVTDPQKGFHLEFSLGDRAELFLLVFEQFGFQGKIAKRRNEVLVYFKSSSVLEDFFTIIGDSSVTIDIINNTIEGQFKSEANRRANSEMSNISRAVATGFTQSELIQRLIDEQKFALLPEELRQTALLRLEHPEASIAQLASISVPSVSKSGLNHRMQKIIDFAKKVFE
jgi:DNA-binding protein WhiA